MPGCYPVLDELTAKTDVFFLDNGVGRGRHLETVL